MHQYMSRPESGSSDMIRPQFRKIRPPPNDISSTKTPARKEKRYAKAPIINSKKHRGCPSALSTPYWMISFSRLPKLLRQATPLTEPLHNTFRATGGIVREGAKCIEESRLLSSNHCLARKDASAESRSANGSNGAEHVGCWRWLTGHNK